MKYYNFRCQKNAKYKKVGALKCKSYKWERYSGNRVFHASRIRRPIGQSISGEISSALPPTPNDFSHFTNPKTTKTSWWRKAKHKRQEPQKTDFNQRSAITTSINRTQSQTPKKVSNGQLQQEKIFFVRRNDPITMCVLSQNAVLLWMSSRDIIQCLLLALCGWLNVFRGSFFSSSVLFELKDLICRRGVGPGGCQIGVAQPTCGNGMWIVLKCCLIAAIRFGYQMYFLLGKAIAYKSNSFMSSLEDKYLIKTFVIMGFYF